MSATQTTNLGLNKPDRQDYVSVVSDINQNMDMIDSSVGNIITPVFSPSTAYSVGDYVIYNRELYRFTTAHPAGAWNSSHVAKTNLAQESNSLKNAIGYIGDVFTYKRFSFQYVDESKNVDSNKDLIINLSTETS